MLCKGCIRLETSAQLLLNTAKWASRTKTCSRTFWLQVSAAGKAAVAMKRFRAPVVSPKAKADRTAVVASRARAQVPELRAALPRSRELGAVVGKFDCSWSS